jgi:dihydroorotate dehydrogenase
MLTGLTLFPPFNQNPSDPFAVFLPKPVRPPGVAAIRQTFYLCCPMYKLLRHIFFRFPTEGIHYFSMNTLQLLCALPPLRAAIRWIFSANKITLRQQIWKLNFRNPIGLAAGFDKNARYLSALEALGFGFVEIGTVTPLAQPGNDKPRLFRLPKDKALINRMGFNNHGVQAVAKRARQFRKRYPQSSLIIGGNIGKNKITPNEEAWKDYETCFKELFDCVDYFVVNVSSPNTPGLRALQEKPALQQILGHLQTLNKQQLHPKPLLLKIAPDLTVEQLDDIIDLARSIPLDGIVATNTTISREGLRTDQATVHAIGNGGLSGLPLRQRSTEIVQYICKQTGGSIPVIASGGIFTADDVKEKREAGAALVQVWTGFVYEGPSIVRKICSRL